MVHVLEPFVAYHKNRGKIVGFPDSLPEFAQKELRKGRLIEIKAEDIEARTIYQFAIDRAVAAIEPVWPAYFREHKRIIRFTEGVLSSQKVRNAFKRSLGEQLAVFFSAYEVYRRLCEHLSPLSVHLFPETNAYLFFRLYRLLREVGYPIEAIPNLTISKTDGVLGAAESFGITLKSAILVTAQSVASLFKSPSRLGEDRLREFTYGVAIISPRQLRDNGRGPDFLVDGKVIRRETVVYFPIYQFPPAALKEIKLRIENIHELPAVGRFFSNPAAWFGLAVRSIMSLWRLNSDPIQVSSNLMFHFFVWNNAMQSLRLKHFITHCDFSISHMGRNIALEQAGVTTWYFSHSMNSGNNLTGYIPECRMRHPYWTYLDYDHFVTWHQALSDYFLEHEGSFRNAHVVGCLWGDGALFPNRRETRLTEPLREAAKGRALIAVFDTTYSRNVTINYEEGIAFADHLLQLAESNPGLFFAFKEKKGREIHKILDPDNGPKLMSLYDRMAQNRNFMFLDNNTNASELIQAAELVISFPFTSTTFEALSMRKPALWHDPLGYYRHNLYERVPGIVTHSYEELNERVRQLMVDEFANHADIVDFPLDSPLMDPFRDGKAKERFRMLLTSSFG